MLRGEQGDDAEDQCCKPTVVQPRAAERRRRAFIAEQHAHANDRVHTDLGEDREHRGDRRTCGRIGRGQPEIERPASCLDQEGHAEERDTCVEQAAVGRGDRAPAQSELRHVERAGHAVDQRRADQEQERGDQIDDDVVQPGFHASGTRAVQDQSVGCGQQHLEKDEQAEQIACQERAVEPHEQELQQWLVVHAHTLPARDRIGKRRQRERGRQHHQHRRQPVDDQNDAVRRRPRADRIDADSLVPDVRHGIGREIHEERGDDELDQDRNRRDRHAPTALRFREQQQDRAREHGHDDRHHRQMLQPGAQASRSCPLTWSVPVKPREASSTTRNSAVVAKPITIAVSTSACGTGSA